MKKKILAVLFIVLFGAGFAATAAEPVGTMLKAKVAADKGQTIQLQPGVKVTLTGKNRGTLRRGSITGEFDCYCDSPAGGSCTLETGGDYIHCYKGQGDTCSSQCTMATKFKGGKSKIVK